MKAIRARALLVGLAMLVAAGMALILTPGVKMADQVPKINLEAMIPVEFGEWKLEDASMPLIGGPNFEAWVKKIYSQTLNRSYLNGKGERIMLVIAYSSGQSSSMQIHLPEVCYPAQGFQVKKQSRGVISFGSARLPVMKLVATQGQRIEPITYWAMIGDSAVRGGLERALARYKYSLTGRIPYGIVIRISTISANESQSYQSQEQFLRDLLDAMPSEQRRILTGQS